MAEKKLQIGISTCPNDTFAFHAILQNKVDLCGLQLDFQLLDISQLNRCLAQQKFDVVKASYAAAIAQADHYVVLPSGSALGFGNGPLLLARESASRPESESQITLCPGPQTTATLLFKIFYGNTQVKHVVFSEIMSSLISKSADFGVCIHEGRFTYDNTGLFLVEDLGKRWESETKCPLPLGGVFAKNTIDTQTVRTLTGVIRKSIQYAMDHREETLESMQLYAQEFSDDVLYQHVDLYVNEWTLNLGTAGIQAIQMLKHLAATNLGFENDQELQIFNA